MTVQHRPLGGHPYRIEPDQRFPVLPRLGEPWELRALAPRAIVAVGVELDVDGRRSTQPMKRHLVADLYDGGDSTDGHLMSASRAVPDVGDQEMWLAEFEAAEGAVIRYRFVADGRRGEWYRVAPGSWRPGEPVHVDGSAERYIAEATEYLETADGVRAVRCSFRLHPSERVAGFGERFDHLDQRGQRLDTTVFEQYQRQGKRTYLPSPFAVVCGDGPGWGIHVRTSRRVFFDVGASDPTRFGIEVGCDDDGRPPSIRVYTGDPADVVAAHLDETGRPSLPPAWVLMPWMSGNEWNTQRRIEAEVDRSFLEGIPVGVVVIEAWSDESTFTFFADTDYPVHEDGSAHRLSEMTFPADGAWPDPVGMVERLHARGVRVLLWQIPLVPTDRGNSGQVAADAAALINNGWCIRHGNGAPYRNRGWWFPGAVLPDWTNPTARQWWIDKRSYLVDEVGIDGFKTDGGEHAWGDDLIYDDGTDGAQSNNLFAQHYAAAYHDLLRRGASQGVTFSRAGFTGAATTPCHWAGDESSTWEALRASIIAGQTAGLSGVLFWGWDIAGFSGQIPSVELWLRATSMGALCPIMQYHSEFNHHRQPCQDRTPWNLAERHGDRRALSGYRWWANLRVRLLPYLTDQARRCVELRQPLMRALCLDHPTDPHVWDVPLQYQLGTDLLVAPVCSPGCTEWDVYLPEGRWVDVWNGEVHEGGMATFAATLARPPILARGSSAQWLVEQFCAEPTPDLDPP